MSVLFAAQQLAGAALPHLTPPALARQNAGAFPASPETKGTWWFTWWLGEKVYSNPTVTTTRTLAPAVMAHTAAGNSFTTAQQQTQPETRTHRLLVWLECRQEPRTGAGAQPCSSRGSTWAGTQGEESAPGLSSAMALLRDLSALCSHRPQTT